MLNIMREGNIKPAKVYRFYCKKCGCIWDTDEVSNVSDDEFEAISNCPHCGANNIVSYAPMGLPGAAKAIKLYINNDYTAVYMCPYCGKEFDDWQLMKTNDMKHCPKCNKEIQVVF